VTQLSLPDKILAVDRAFERVPHAFGGAISLAYHAEPRATIDIDVNVFVPVDRVDEILDSADMPLWICHFAAMTL